jgi:hypothetical protein
MSKSNFDEIISKSLDEIDEIVDKVSKSQDDEDLSAGDVSEDAPQEEDNQEDQEQPTDNDGGGEDAPAEDGDGDPNNEDTDADQEGEQDSDEDENVEKSLEDTLNSNSSVKKALEVSEFLQELVKGISTSIKSQGSTLAKSILDSANDSNELLAKSIVGIAKGQRAVLETQVELLKSVKAMGKRIQQLESQPMVRKSVANAQPVQKSFQASAGQVPAKTNSLTKSQASAKLMVSYESGNHDILGDILALEGTGSFDALSDKAKAVLNI